MVAVGFAHNKYALEKKLPGWEADTFAVHSDDGCFFKDGTSVDRKWTYVLVLKTFSSLHGHLLEAKEIR